MAPGGAIERCVSMKEIGRSASNVPFKSAGAPQVDPTPVRLFAPVRLAAPLRIIPPEHAGSHLRVVPPDSPAQTA